MNLQATSGPYLTYVEEWLKSRPTLKANEVFERPEKVAIFTVDVIKGFCCEGAGPLASARVGQIVKPIKELLTKAHQSGVDLFFFPEDNHPADSLEFNSFPPHCIKDTAEAERVDELTQLPFSHLFSKWPKKVVNAAIEHLPNIYALFAVHNPDTIIVTGDCTDLCTFHLAQNLKQFAIARGLDVAVIVPMDCVQTYDLPVEVAQQIGAEPHPGDLWHALALHNMHLSGITVVQSIQ